MRARFTALGAALLAIMLAATVVPSSTLGGSAGAATPDVPAVSNPAPVVEPGVYTVTLVTGDRVTVTQEASGYLTVDLEPASRAAGEPNFEWVDAGEDFYVLPEDARAFVGEQLDMELFNVTKLVRFGYHDEGTGHLPVIVAYPEGPQPMMRQQASLADATPLESINGAAAALDAEDAAAFWAEAATPSSGLAATSTSALAGVEKVWLDGLVEVELDESIHQVGAPTAWDAGYDGEGARVAILDTGIDETHPDVAGQVVAAESFVPGESPNDGHGHGTHVGATAAGTGGAGDVDRPGVAPGADLANAKVLNNAGSGQESWIIAGMEWAAQQGYEVANMSLGGAVTDGTDPLSAAVDSLTEQYGILFVISAGNSGASGITTPGPASSALTVGAVDKSDTLAWFSSIGPRLGDYAIKPDITAPGVDIVAARAAGTSMGTPVDEYYTSANGTSMAAPHVAGAAAIIAQQRPDWDWSQIKAALATTAVPHASYTVYEQGGGRLDVAAAVEAEVLATPAPLDLGYFPHPHDDLDPVTEQVTYTNLGDEDITLDLALDVTDDSGNAPEDGMLTLGQESVTVPAGGSAAVDVTLDVTVGDYALYGGYLVAERDGETVTHTPVGFFKESERYDLIVEAIDTEGNPATGGLTIMNVDDPDAYFELTVNYDANGVAHVRVPPGPYAVYGFADTHPEGETFATVRTAMAEPEIQVDDDTTVVFDARTANEITVDAPEHDVEPRIRTTLTLFRRAATGFGASRGVQAFADGTTFQAGESEEASTGLFEFVSRWQLADPDEPIETPVLYDVVFPETGAIPADLDYVVYPHELVTAHQEFHTHVEDHEVREFRHWWRPWQTSSLGIAEEVPAPGIRTDYLATADTQWTRNTLFAPTGYSSLAARMNAPRMEYQPGHEYTRPWYQQAVVPGLLEGSPWHPSFPQYRIGNTLELFIAEFSDTGPGHWSWYQGSIDEAEFRLYEDDELIAEAGRPQGSFELSEGESRIRMETDIRREGLDWWLYSTQTSTAWEFDSATTPDAISRIISPETIDLDVDYLTGSPELQQDLDTHVVYAGLGHPEDFENLNAEGSIAFIRRGDIPFAEKAQNAADAGAEVAIIFNNVPGTFAGTVGDDGVIPTFALSMEEGEAVVDLLEDGDVTMEMSAGGQEMIPMLLVDYDTQLDLLNRFPHPGRGAQTLELTVRHQPDLADPPAIAGARLWTSLDDGESWRRIGNLRSIGDGVFRAQLNRGDDEDVDALSVRVEAWDADGNTIEQEVIRAFGLAVGR